MEETRRRCDVVVFGSVRATAVTAAAVAAVVGLLFADHVIAGPSAV